MTKYAEAAERLRKLYCFLDGNSIPVPTTEFTSNLGEWLVMDKLIQNSHSPTLQSGQFDVDIVLSKGERVEVKSATWDSDFGGVYRFDRIKPEKLDFLICVKFEEGYSTAEFYVFTKDEVEELPPRNQSAFDDPERSGNQRLLRVLDDPENSNRKDMREINRRLGEFQEAWHKLETAEK